MNERSRTLQRLETLVGKWNVELMIPGDPPIHAQTQASFQWLDDQRFFLVYRAGTEGSGFPVGHCIIGGDGTLDTYTMLYSDSRGIARIYQMTLTDTEWRQWRDDPQFLQRFFASISKDRQTLTGAWGNSEDGVDWKRDFDLIYTRLD